MDRWMDGEDTTNRRWTLMLGKRHSIVRPVQHTRNRPCRLRLLSARAQKIGGRNVLSREDHVFPVSSDGEMITQPTNTIQQSP
jgi:hypothetical protein